MAKGAKKKELDPEVEARVKELLDGVKKARDLEALRDGLVALARGGDAGAEAMRRLQPPFRTFGGAVPGEEEQAISWDQGRLLVVEDGLESARLVLRRGQGEEAPPSGEQKAASNDEREGAQSASAEGTGETLGPDPETTGADPETLKAALLEAFQANKIEVLRAGVKRGPRGTGLVELFPKEGPKQVLHLDAETWGQPASAIVSGIVEAMTAGGG